MTDDRYFVDHRPGGNANHVYDRQKPAENFRGDTWRTSLCGQSATKTTNANSLAANRDGVDCGTCRRILESRVGGR